MKLELGIGTILVSLCLTHIAQAADLTGSATTNDVIVWNNAALEAIRVTRPGPSIAARDLAILQTGVFDAWAAYDSEAVGTQLGDTLRRPASEHTLENKNEAISYAAYRTLTDLFPSQASAFNNVMTSLGYTPTDTSTDSTTASGIGNLAAQTLLDFRHHDGSNQLGDLHPGAYSDYTGYKPVNTPDQINDPDRWQPLRVPNGNGGFVVQNYVTPFWSKVTPFAMTSGDQFRPSVGPKTLTWDPVGYKQQAEEILNLSAHLTDQQKAIAEYWADGPNSELPPGHWNLFAQFVSQRDRHDLDADVKMFFALDNAMLDASIATWDAKTAYDSERPITAIHYLFNGQKVEAWGGPNQGTKLIDGADWQPYQAANVVTPAFAEYTSGHSAFSAAGAEILTQFTGSDVFGDSYTQKAGTSRVENGPSEDVTLSWDTFSDAADEAGISRRYGGIHFADGDLAGRAIGREVGAQAWDKAQSYISPQSVPEPDFIWGTLALTAISTSYLLKSKKSAV